MPETPAAEWRPISGFPYEVSNDGHVRRSAPGQSTRPGRMLKGCPNRDGYLVVRLSKNGRAHTKTIHRLVCTAFHGASDLPEVRHLDGNPGNNKASNLAWGTSLENGSDRIRHGTAGRGRRRPAADNTVLAVSDIGPVVPRYTASSGHRAWVQAWLNGNGANAT